ncbi:MAG: signal recognition particle protein [Deltaproteobacteria bacterium]|nr:signal recognition particle protein [Deltaproteobacteria bacterium]
MFEGIATKIEKVFKKLRGQARLTEANIEEALSEVRLALLDADVNIEVVQSFISEVRARAIGEEVLDSITPGQQVIKIVHAKIVELLGGSGAYIRFGSKIPAPIMLVGLQGCGKTTTAAKLARHFIATGKRTYLVPADTYRPAAIEQLQILAQQIGTEAYSPTAGDSPVAICASALNEARRKGYEVAIIDTAGRTQLDAGMMKELKDIVGIAKPAEILFVADAMMGQEAVNVAREFNSTIPLDGVILTKMDSDARGGAALSLKTILGKPIKFIGVGEKISELEAFYPDRVAGRILGMGDIVTLVEKARNATSEKEAQALEQKLRKNELSLEDFRDQILQMQKMGSVQDIVGMIPGMGNLKQVKNARIDEKELVKTVAIINSMTPRERRVANIIDGSRRKRIANGSGSTVQDVNRVLKQYEEMKKMMKMFANKGALARIAKAKFPFK